MWIPFVARKMASDVARTHDSSCGGADFRAEPAILQLYTHVQRVHTSFRKLLYCRIQFRSQYSKLDLSRVSYFRSTSTLGSACH
jgi:hypothetical protein